MIFTPFAYMAATGTPVTPTNPVTSGLVFGMEFGPGQSYPGTGTTITDSSTFGETGTLTGGTYTSNRYISFVSADAIEFAGTFSQLALTTEWSMFGYLKINQTGALYLVEKSTSPGLDNLSLVGNFNANQVRPWNGSYRGMPGLTISQTLATIAFTKDANGVANNYKSYKDGTNVDTVSSNFTLTSNDTGVNVNDFSAGAFDLYNWYYYDRALSAAEVTSLHNYVTSY